MNRIVAMLFIFAAVGCKQADSQTDNAPTVQPAAPEMHADSPKPMAAADKPAADKPATDVPADNTGKNERDRDTAALTPLDQGGSEGDRSITQHIRADVVKADDVSMNGKNVKIITVDGVVTLRGPVETAREKKDIAAIAKRVDGVKRIDNQLEIASK
jgi:hyperosmotically inducible protein